MRVKRALLFSAALFLLPTAVFASPGSTDTRGCHRCTVNCAAYGLDYGQLHCHEPKEEGPVNFPVRKVWTRATRTSVPVLSVKSVIRSLERRRGTDAPVSAVLSSVGRAKLAQPRASLLRGQRQLTSYLREQMRGFSTTFEGKVTALTRYDLVTGVEVMKVEDGETLEVRFPNGNFASIALAGLESPSRRNQADPQPCYAKESAGRLMRLLARKPVDLEDVPYLSYDRMGRIVRYVYLGTEDIGAALIRDGYAFSDPVYPHPNADYYDALEDEARQGRRGLWGVQCSYYEEYKLR